MIALGQLRDQHALTAQRISSLQWPGDLWIALRDMPRFAPPPRPKKGPKRGQIYLLRIPESKRKQGLLNAEIVADTEAKGRAVSMAHAQLAAIARLYDAVIATGNVRHFETLGVALVNPRRDQV